MIRLIQDKSELLPWAGDPIGARACAAAAAYGIGGHAAQFWRQNGDTLLCRVDDAMLALRRFRSGLERTGELLPHGGRPRAALPGRGSSPSAQAGIGDGAGDAAARHGAGTGRGGGGKSQPARTARPCSSAVKPRRFTPRNLSRFISTFPTGRATA